MSEIFGSLGNIFTIDHVDLDDLIGSVSKVSLGFNCKVVTQLAFSSFVCRDVQDILGGAGSIRIINIAVYNHKYTLIAHSRGLCVRCHLVPVVADLHFIWRTSANAGHFSLDGAGLCDHCVVSGRVVTGDDHGPVVLGNTFIDVVILKLIGLVARGDTGGANVGDFGHGHRGYDHGIDLAVAIVVDELNFIRSVGIPIVVDGLQGFLGIGIIVVDNILTQRRFFKFVLYTVELHLFGVVGDRIQLSNGTCCQHLGVLVGVNTIHGVVADLHQDVHLLAHQIGIILGDLGVSISIFVCLNGVSALAVLFDRGHNTAVFDFRVVLVLQQGDRIVGIVQLVNSGHLGGVAAHPSVLILNFASLQGVPHHLGRSVAGQGSGDIQTFQALVQALLGGTDVDIHVPSVAGVALDVRIEAQADQQHLSQLGAGHIAVGAEPAAAHTRHDALGHAGLNVLLRPSSVGGVAHVGERGGGRCAQGGLLAAVQGHADHLADLGPLNVPFGLIGPVRIPADDVQRRARINGLGVLDLVLIRERRPGAHDHDRQHHSHTEHQAQNLLLGKALISQRFASQFPTGFPRRSHSFSRFFRSSDLLPNFLLFIKIQ